MRLPVLDRPILHVTQAFLQDPKPSGQTPEQMTYWGGGGGELLRLEAVGKSIRRIMKEFDADPTKSDGSIAVDLHRSLRLTRQEAAHLPFWHFLSIAELPAYVAWRYFDPAKGKTNRERYAGRLDVNAFARLWWWAELTFDDHHPADPYHRTKKGSQNLELVKSVVENLFGGNRALVASLIDFVCASPERMADQQVKQLTIRINALLVTVAVDLLPESAIRRLPSDISATFGA